MVFRITFGSRLGPFFNLLTCMMLYSNRSQLIFHILKSFSELDDFRARDRGKSENGHSSGTYNFRTSHPNAIRNISGDAQWPGEH